MSTDHDHESDGIPHSDLVKGDTKPQPLEEGDMKVLQRLIAKANESATIANTRTEDFLKAQEQRTKLFYDTAFNPQLAQVKENTKRLHRLEGIAALGIAVLLTLVFAEIVKC